MNITHILYEYSCNLDLVKALIEKGRTESAMKEIEKLQKQIENDYITSLVQ